MKDRGQDIHIHRTAGGDVKVQARGLERADLADLLWKTLLEIEPGRALHWGAIPNVCRKCSGPCEGERACYAVPGCFSCLPPPPLLRLVGEDG